MSDLNILLHDECQLVDWGESRSGGPWIKLRLNDPGLLDPFRGMDTATATKTGHILNVTIAEGDIVAAADPPKPEPKEPNYLARDMVQSGYFRNPHLWDAMESAGMINQTQHKAMIESMPCLFSHKNMKEFIIGRDPSMNPIKPEKVCVGDVVGHHCRTAENSGTSIKPKHWYLIPLCHIHHRQVHDFVDRAGRELLLTRAINITNRVAFDAVKEKLSLDSMSELTPDELGDFEKYLEEFGFKTAHHFTKREWG